MLRFKPALAAAISRVWVLHLTAFALKHVQLCLLIGDVSAGRARSLLGSWEFRNSGNRYGVAG